MATAEKVKLEKAVLVSKTKKAIADAVTDSRNQRGWSQTDLAKKAHVSQARVSEVENAARDYRIGTAEKVLRALGLRLIVVT